MLVYLSIVKYTLYTQTQPSTKYHHFAFLRFLYMHTKSQHAQRTKHCHFAFRRFLEATSFDFRFADVLLWDVSLLFAALPFDALLRAKNFSRVACLPSSCFFYSAVVFFALRFSSRSLLISWWHYSFPVERAVDQVWTPDHSDIVTPRFRLHWQNLSLSKRLSQGGRIFEAHLWHHD